MKLIRKPLRNVDSSALASIYQLKHNPSSTILVKRSYRAFNFPGLVQPIRREVKMNLEWCLRCAF